MFLSLGEMDQKLKFGRTIGYGDSYLYFATPKYSDYMQYYTMLPEQFDYKPVKDPAKAT